jgi:hypothetical protein
MADPINIVCEHCGSDDIIRDANARWDTLNQCWDLAGVMDNATCEACGEETDMIEVPLL